MKNNLFLVVLLVFISVGCKEDKKEKQSELENNSVSGKVDSLSSNKDSVIMEGDEIIALSDTANSKEKTQEISAFMDNGSGKKAFQYNLQKGKTYPYTIKEKEEQKIEAEGKSESITNETYDELTFTINDVVGDVYKVRVNFISKKTTLKAQGKTLSISTNEVAPKDKALAQTYKLYKALVGNSFTMDLDKNGIVSNIKGMEKIYSKVESVVKKDLKGDELNAFMDAIKSTLNPKVFKAQFEAVRIQFPQSGVQQGDTWSDKPKTSISDINYKLTKLDNSVAEVSISSAMKPDSKSDTQNGVTLKASIKGGQNGTIILDASSGWIKKGNIVTTVAESQSMTDGKRTEKITKTVISTTQIN